MATVSLYRFRFSRLCTIGVMMHGGESFFTLELPWRDNKRNISCIPEGSYHCEYMSRSASGKYKRVYHVTGVDGRSGILIHNGNIHTHTKGCILLGMRIGTLLGLPAVLNSKCAMSSFVRSLNKNPFTLRIKEW